MDTMKRPLTHNEKVNMCMLARLFGDACDAATVGEALQIMAVCAIAMRHQQKEWEREDNQPESRQKRIMQLHEACQDRRHTKLLKERIRAFRTHMQAL